MTTTTDTDTTALADLDVDLEQVVPCESVQSCDAEATQRATVHHAVPAAVCATRFYCDVHAGIYRRFLAEPGKNICRWHDLEVWVAWQPLNPGRR